LSFAEKVVFSKDYVPMLENWIDEMTPQLPPLKNFILPVSSLALIFLIQSLYQLMCSIF
jgi:cob(I)alamin adenosyltransferase